MIFNIIIFISLSSNPFYNISMILILLIFFPIFSSAWEALGINPSEIDKCNRLTIITHSVMQHIDEATSVDPDILVSYPKSEVEIITKLMNGSFNHQSIERKNNQLCVLLGIQPKEISLLVESLIEYTHTHQIIPKTMLSETLRRLSISYIEGAAIHKLLTYIPVKVLVDDVSSVDDEMILARELLIEKINLLIREKITHLTETLSKIREISTSPKIECFKIFLQVVRKKALSINFADQIAVEYLFLKINSLEHSLNLLLIQSRELLATLTQQISTLKQQLNNIFGQAIKAGIMINQDDFLLVMDSTTITEKRRDLITQKLKYYQKRLCSVKRQS